MSEQRVSNGTVEKSVQTNGVLRRINVRERVSRISTAKFQGMFGVPEIAALASSGLLLLVVIFSYFYFQAPAASRLKALESERQAIQNRIRQAQVNIDLDADPQATLAEVRNSLGQFERNSLQQRSVGRMALYNQLNELMLRNKLRNTAGPAYAALDALGGNASATATEATRTGTAKWQSLYPGIGISVTVEGQYINVRHFMRDIEASGQFLIINAVELEGVTDSESPQGATLVSLHLDMATYFQRDGLDGAMDATQTR